MSLPTSTLPKSPSASSPLGGCPASCPDTYRLTHDHRHVRNWARAEIGVLSLLRKIFFRLWGNFPNRCFFRTALGARLRVESEQTLSFWKRTPSPTAAAPRFVDR